MRLFAVTLFAVLAFASPAFASSVRNVSVDNSVPSNAAGARGVYRIAFTTSATGALSGTDAGSSDAAAQHEPRELDRRDRHGRRNDRRLLLTADRPEPRMLAQ